MRGGVFQANYSKLGQRKKTTFHQLFLCLHEGWQRFGCRMFLPSECDRATKTKQTKNALSSVWNNLPRTQTACLPMLVNKQPERDGRFFLIYFFKLCGQSELRSCVTVEADVSSYLEVRNSPYGACGRKATLIENASESTPPLYWLAYWLDCSPFLW